MAAIEVSGLNKTFNRKTRALRNVDMRIHAGEMVALIGASGSGKSTLLRHIGGLIAADSGDIRVFGANMQSGGRVTRDARQVRVRIGVVFQQFNLVSRLSVLTNVLTGVLGQMPGWRGALGLFNNREKRAAMRALARVGIAGAAAQRASTLSGGQQQRAAIARALVQGADIILADEPIASLDPASSKRVMEVLLDINETDGRTILVSLHQVDYAVRFCRRTVALRDGAVVYDGPSSALTTDILRTLYGDDCDELLGHAEAAGVAPRHVPMPASGRDLIAISA
ncbi:MAG: phosphonate ABC transporter ATP-binding protein [Alphaproteobacteria bacterium]